jgi:hypothetical protein
VLTPLRVQPLDTWVDPADAFATLFGGPGGADAVWLDSGPDAIAGSSFMGTGRVRMSASVADGTVTIDGVTRPGEVLDALRADRGIALSDADARRNVVTRGVALGDLLGRRFAVGQAECIGVRDCPPCAHLESLTEPGVHRALEGNGGLRAEILAGGRIAVGDPITLLDG